MKKIGVLLSGCGVYDGSEIHEAVLTLLAIDRHGAKAVCMAPDIDQAHVINHVTGKTVEGEKRNVLVESARIARGDIRKLGDVTVDDIDALVLPGGFGAAKNLCDFAFKGEGCEVHADVVRLVNDMVWKKKPVAAACIAPAVLARVLGKDRAVNLTIGADKETAEKLHAMGARHTDCPAIGFVVDKANKIVSTPAYMLASRISEVADGINKMIEETIALI